MRSKQEALAVAVFCAASLTLGCGDRLATPPEEPYRGPAIFLGPGVRSATGMWVSKARMASLLSLVTREVAMALRDDQVRRAIYDALHASPYPEHKLQFQALLSGEGRSLLAAMARGSLGSEATVLATLDSIADLEFYIPDKEHWRVWAGGPELLVASELDDDGSLPVALDPGGNPVQFESAHNAVYKLPAVPTLSLVPAETDFSRAPAAAADVQRSALDAGPGLYMVSSYISQLQESPLRGSPEIEVHAFPRNGAGNFVDAQCAGEHQATPFQFDQQDHSWSGPEVKIIPEDGVGTNPVEVSVWEDDITACDPSTGRPPHVSQGTMDQYTAWGSRPTVTVSLVNSVKVVSFASLGVPLALYVDTTVLNRDDDVGEARVPTCWPSSGPTYFALYLSDASHTWNGNARLDFRFGQRDPICPPPSFSVSVDGPSSAPAYSSVTATAIPANYVSPVHYVWTINGTSACGDATTCTGNLGAEGTYTEFAVTATDGTGSQATGSRSIFAEYSGCPDCMSPGRAPSKRRPTP